MKNKEVLTTFGPYSEYYDLLYKDKDYVSEAKYVNKVLQRCLSGTQSILELGCGTGAHAVHLVKKGYTIHGVDMSDEMLARAEKRKQELATEFPNRFSFSKGDIRNVRLNQKFDAVIALFHVISYLPENKDIEATLSTVKAHLKAGGVFLFDCWYGPAVLTERPEVKVKRFEDDDFQIVRVAEPKMTANDNIVEVRYQLFVENVANGRIEKIRESHRMRYLFKPEIEMLLKSAGMQIVEFSEWMTDREPGFDTWSVYFVGRV